MNSLLLLPLMPECIIYGLDGAKIRRKHLSVIPFESVLSRSAHTSVRGTVKITT